MSFKALLLVGVIFSFLTTGTVAQDTSLIMEKYFERLGGKDKVSGVTASSERSFNWFRTSKTQNSEEATPIEVQVLTKEPVYRKFTSYDFFGNITNEFFYNDEGLTDVSKFSVRKEKTSPISVSVCSAKDLYKLYSEGHLKYYGLKEFKGNKYYVIKSDDQKRNEIFYFNQETFLLEARQFEDRPDRVDYFKDYRKTNLILHPFLFESFENDTLYYRQSTVEFMFNQEIRRTEFRYNPKSRDKEN